jgi:hypothetical protein
VTSSSCQETCTVFVRYRAYMPIGETIGWEENSFNFPTEVF